MDSKTIQLGVVTEISTKDFDDYYELSRRCIARGELCEIRHCKDKRSAEVKLAKVYRKADLPNDDAI